MIRVSKTIASVAVLLLCSGCDRNPAPDSRTEAPDTGSEEDQDDRAMIPADPDIVPAGFESLNLSQEQAEQLNHWLQQQQPSAADPADLARKVRSILRPEQLPAFRKLIEQSNNHTDHPGTN